MQHFLFSCASPPSHRKGRLIKFDDDDDNNDDDVIKLLSKYIVQYSFLFPLFKRVKESSKEHGSYIPKYSGTFLRPTVYMRCFARLELSKVCTGCLSDL